MTPRAWSSVVPFGFLLALLQLVTASAKPAAGAAGAVAVGLSAAWSLRRLGIGIDSWWAAPLFAAVAGAAGSVLPMLSGPPKWGMLCFPAIAAFAASILAFRRAGSEILCAACSRPIMGASFDCPRCGVTVCDQDCWNYDGSRCRACAAGRVPILPPDPAWWERNLGRRIVRGRCQHCLTAAETADLRACPECARAFCRDCWDSNNGQCARCSWVIRELPAALRRYVLSYEPRASATRRVRPRTG